MTPENFCYWLQGLLEIGDPSELNMTQVLIIKDHLNLVFKKETKTLTVKPKLSDFLQDKNIFHERFKVKSTPTISDYLSPWASPPTITC
jgi:hypothetical protein